MNLRFATWNVNRRRPRPSHLEFTRSVDPAVLALQEASPGFVKALRASGLFAFVASSGDLAGGRPPRRSDFYCALAVRDSLAVGQPFALPLPERSLALPVAMPDGSGFLACSVHIPCWVSWKQLKGNTFAALSRWLERTGRGGVLGIDANAPKVDHPEHELNEWRFPEEALVLGAQAPHALADAYRLWLLHNPSALDAIRSQRPVGPLAISHKTWMRKRERPRRYDFVLVPSDAAVADVVHHYDDAILAGSGHGLVVADLCLSSGAHTPMPTPQFPEDVAL